VTDLLFGVGGGPYGEGNEAWAGIIVLLGAVVVLIWFWMRSRDR
jgi:hypothetical protein